MKIAAMFPTTRKERLAMSACYALVAGAYASVLAALGWFQ